MIIFIKSDNNYTIINFHPNYEINSLVLYHNNIVWYNIVSYYNNKYISEYKYYVIYLKR